jgi:predicted RNA methylase
MNIQKKGLDRNTIDKFYTSQLIANDCINKFKKIINIKDNDLCIEPSAGNGSFINAIKKNFKYYKFYDIEPENNDIIQQDYLDFNYNELKNKYNNIHIIGNPPFGRQSSMAIKFIKKSSEYCDSISFILPKSFKKDSLKNKIPFYFHLIYEFDLPQNSFIINDKQHDVPCVFQIWIKKTQKRSVIQKLTSDKFNFVKKTELHDISFRRVGVNASYIDINTIDKSIQTHYFIKFNIELNDEILNKLKNINYECKNYTCGPKSISKQELIKEFNKII